eukprot:1196347-Prorocentrum_minimum.AAC.9
MGQQQQQDQASIDSRKCDGYPGVSPDIGGGGRGRGRKAHTFLIHLYTFDLFIRHFLSLQLSTPGSSILRQIFEEQRVDRKGDAPGALDRHFVFAHARDVEARHLAIESFFDG